ncbi:hypothetical protein [Mammaliicoccus lentus]|uniref:class III lanthionine synthetase LanKC N-terminal domain-containing protein n=1 Tax=Mammaliicoccus lentus TaxID=42858 RepID=UPI0026499953|nr:hypothetical protein [Mammaliicoccus lentus]
MNKYNLILSKILQKSKGKHMITLKKYWIIFGDRKDIPVSGIKIHVSISTKICEKFILEISSMLNKNNYIWKLPNSIEVASYITNIDNNKIRGKFFTVYPRDNNEFLQIINKLLCIDDIFKECIDIREEYHISKSRIYFRYYDKEVEQNRLT